MKVPILHLDLWHETKEAAEFYARLLSLGFLFLSTHLYIKTSGDASASNVCKTLDDRMHSGLSETGVVILDIRMGALR